MVIIKAIQAGTGKWAEFPAALDSPLLDQMEQHCLFEVPYMCSMGACGSCAVAVLKGRECLDPAAFGVGCSAETAEGRVLPCVAGVSIQSAAGPHLRRVVLESP